MINHAFETTFDECHVILPTVLLLNTYTVLYQEWQNARKRALTLSAHLGRLFVFVVSFLVKSLFPTNDLKRNDTIDIKKKLTYQ